MKTIWTIAKRELSIYFSSPVAYVFIVIFLLLAGFFTFDVGSFFERGVADLSPSFFIWHPWLYLFLVPAVGMRLWSEELRSGTIELLFTISVTNWAPAWVVDSLASLGVMTHFESLQRGVVDSRDLLFFVSMIAFCLFANSVVLRAHRA